MKVDCKTCHWKRMGGWQGKVEELESLEFHLSWEFD
jgi:hypothetical protein